MKMHFLPSEQRSRVTRFRAALRTLTVLLVCICIGHLVSALYLIENPAQIAVPQVGDGGTAHDVALVSPAWIISTINDGPKATALLGSWQSSATLVRDAEIGGARIYLYKLESPDASRSAMLEYPETGQEVRVPGKPNLLMHLAMADDGTGTVDQDVSGLIGRPVNPVSDSSVLGIVVSDGSGKTVVLTTSQLMKAFPELAH